MTNPVSVDPVDLKALNDIRRAVKQRAYDRKPGEILVEVINILDAYGEATANRIHEDPRTIVSDRLEIERQIDAGHPPIARPETDDEFVEYSL